MREKLVDARAERARTIDNYVPFDCDEFEANNKRHLPLITTFFAEGTEDSLISIKNRCKKEKVWNWKEYILTMTNKSNLVWTIDTFSCVLGY